MSGQTEFDDDLSDVELTSSSPTDTATEELRNVYNSDEVLREVDDKGEAKGVISLNATRWGSTHKSFERIVGLQEAIKLYFESDKKNKAVNLHPSEWLLLKEVLVILEVPMQVTKLLQLTNYSIGAYRSVSQHT